MYTGDLILRSSTTMVNSIFWSGSSFCLFRHLHNHQKCARQVHAGSGWLAAKAFFGSSEMSSACNFNLSFNAD